MAFKRTVVVEHASSHEETTAAMAGIGMRFAVRPTPDANIEDTIWWASSAGMRHDDLRVLAVLLTWLDVHSAAVNVDRLTRIVTAQAPHRVKAFWSAVARWKSADRRWSKLAKLYDGPRVELLSVGSDFQIQRHEEDERFAGGPLRVPANVLRRREDDVLTRAELARRHRAYRCRVMMGPSYRADVWAVLEAEPGLSAAEVARRAHASFATAWQVKQDWAVVA